MAETKPDLTRVWASAAPGANVVDPDTTTPDKFIDGWLAEVPPFEHFNFLQQLFTQGLAHNNEQGINVWDTDTVYPEDALVKGSNGEIYKALSEQSSNDPISDGAVNWKLILIETLSDPRSHGAIFDDATDIGPVLNTMLGLGLAIVMPNLPTVIDTKVDILDNSVILFAGSKVRTTDDTLIMFEANSKDDWALLGSVEIRGTLVGSGSSAETGLKVLGGRRFKVENVTCRLFQGKGFDFDNDGTSDERGQKGQLNNCAAYECTLGWDFNDGQSAEYQVLTGCSAAGCVTGVRNQVGNTNWSGGNITDNGTGIELVVGANSNHGMFSNVNINHNDISLSATDVTLGYSFNNCHWYGDSSSLGKIYIENSKGIDINGGQLDARIEVQDGAATLNGLNLLRNMQIVGSNFNLFGDDLINLRSYGHYDFVGQVQDAYLSVQPTFVLGGVGFQNSWVNFGGTRNAAGFYLSEIGNVQLQGMVSTGTVNQIMFTLPIGYRPEQAIELIVNSNGAAGFLFIDTGGNVTLTAGSNTKVSLDGVQFRAKT